MSKCLIFDTNALLDLYALKKDTTEEIINAIKTCDFQIVILPQVYSEYYDKYKANRTKTSSRNPINLFEKNFNFQKQKISPLISSLKLNHLSKKYDTKIDDLIDEFSQNFESFKSQIDEEIKNLKQNLSFDYTNEHDVVKDFVDEYYDSSLELTIANKLDLVQWFENRIKLHLKPGVTDSDKKENTYGDMFIWYDILKLGSNYDEIYFIENEKKDDWWEKRSSNKIDPCLLKEFKENNSSELYMFHLIDFCEKYLAEHMSVKSLQEVCNIRKDIKRDINEGKFLEHYENVLYDCNKIQRDLEEHLNCQVINGGNIDEIHDFDIDDIKISNLIYEEGSISSDVIVKSKAMINLTGIVRVYYFKESVEYFMINVEMIYDLVMRLSINFEDGNVLISPNGYQISFDDFNKIEKLLDLSYEEHDYEEYY
ncbi:MAG: DUF4935 domain-containing protein [Bacilli bacterium]|nr:DUF4935 domain-containing protein [Bacilli bacterium]